MTVNPLFSRSQLQALGTLGKYVPNPGKYDPSLPFFILLTVPKARRDSTPPVIDGVVEWLNRPKPDVIKNAFNLPPMRLSSMVERQPDYLFHVRFNLCSTQRVENTGILPPEARQ